MASFVFNISKGNFFSGAADWDTSSIKGLLVDNAGTAAPDRDNDHVLQVLNSVANNELNTTGYTRGPGSTSRKTLTNAAVIVDDTNDRAVLRADRLLWDDGPGIGGGVTAKGVLIYRHVSGSDDTLNIPICWFDDGGFPFVTNGGSLTVQWANTVGILGDVCYVT